MIKTAFTVFLVVSVLLLVSLRANGQNRPHDWRCVASDHIVYGISTPGNAIHGRVSALIDTTKLNFDELAKNEVTRNFTTTIKLEDLLHGYVTQTIDSMKYRGKHLHISAYIKSIVVDLENIVEQYEISLAQAMGTRYPDIDNPEEYFNDYIQDSSWYFQNRIYRIRSKTRYGIMALPHTNEKFTIPEMTRDPGTDTSDWQRFNAEIEVPDDSTHISLVFWNSGLGKAYVDHFAVVPQGPTTLTENNTTRSWYQDRYHDKLLFPHIRSAEEIAKDDFEYLSFEDRRLDCVL